MKNGRYQRSCSLPFLDREKLPDRVGLTGVLEICASGHRAPLALRAPHIDRAELPELPPRALRLSRALGAVAPARPERSKRSLPRFANARSGHFRAGASRTLEAVASALRERSKWPLPRSPLRRPAASLRRGKRRVFRAVCGSNSRWAPRWRFDHAPARSVVKVPAW